VVAELESLAVVPPVKSGEVMARARMVWAQIYSVAVGASTAQYFKLQQIEATAYTRSLEQGLQTLQRMEQQRAQLWQEAAHDLRGNLGVVSNATAGLGARHADPAVQESFLRLLGKNVQALHRLLDDVTVLARLQSGQEERKVDAVDVEPLFRELWESLEGHAKQKGLSFELQGPAPFNVRSDAVKLRRIAQNLVLNAIRYTHKGGVELSWGDCGPEDPDRWMLVIADTGPGIGTDGSSELKNALEVATQHADQVAFDSKEDKVTHIEDEDADVPAPASSPQADKHGEGIGLSIVKRLCELLDATVQVDSDASGTRFEILLPRDYE
jgi:signal transduction histidine kinase